MAHKWNDDEVIPSKLSIRLSLLKVNGGDHNNIWYASSRLDMECIKGNRSREAAHSCHKDSKSFKPWQHNKPVLVQPILSEDLYG